jgi:hypothetical protein
MSQMRMECRRMLQHQSIGRYCIALRSYPLEIKFEQGTFTASEKAYQDSKSLLGIPCNHCRNTAQQGKILSRVRIED